MLELRGVTKIYKSGAMRVEALKDVDLRFRPSEFVAILGPSGCGKTTLLNVIGGLDRATEGELLIRGTSTRRFKDRDWDAYRNHSVGFVFQTYNLIPHQTALANVELALTLSGVGKGERRCRAEDVLRRVGLADQLHKRPNQMSGGQMQRVAIARALVNNPDILLADEPTGALDSETSVEVLDILRRVAEERLVVMVTHNAEFAQTYATRIVRLLDGEVVSDSKAPEAGAGSGSGAGPEAGAGSGSGAGSEPEAGAGSGSGAGSEPEAGAGSGSGAGSEPEAGAGSGSGAGSEPGAGAGSGSGAGSEPEAGARSGSGAGAKPGVGSGSGSEAGAGPGAGAGSGSEAGSEPEAGARSGSGAGAEPGSGAKPGSEPGSEAVPVAGGEIFPATRRDPRDGSGSKLGGPAQPRLPSMAFGTALALSFNNLLTKKTRTLLTAFAGSIGIIGIALILSLSGGFRQYVAGAEEEMLASYPITLEREVIAADPSAFRPPRSREAEPRDEDAVYVNSHLTDMMRRRAEQRRTNDLGAFKRYLEERAAAVAVDVAAISYGYDVKFSIFRTDDGDRLARVHPSRLLDVLGFSGLVQANPAAASMTAGLRVWEEIVDDEAFLRSRYELVAGEWPRSMEELLLVVNRDGEMMETVLYGLGLANPMEAALLAQAVRPSPTDDSPATRSFTFDEFFRLRYRAAATAEQYAPVEDSFLWQNRGDDVPFMRNVLARAPELRIAGIARPASEDEPGGGGGFIGYLPALTEHFIAAAEEADVVQAQRARPDVNVLTGRALAEDGLQEALAALGVVDRNEPEFIRLYTRDFQSRARVTALVEEYNERQREEGREERIVQYTDFIRLILSSVTTVVDSVSYVLIAFVAISLVVSSIMIGVIGHISVLERIKEIGVLRSLGASKRDVARVFNAEAVIIGLGAGVLGVGLSGLLRIPVNMVIEAVAGVPDVAVLPWTAAGSLVALSVLLTLVASLLPARAAARQDPVEALRTE